MDLWSPRAVGVHAGRRREGGGSPKINLQNGSSEWISRLHIQLKLELDLENHRELEDWKFET